MKLLITPGQPADHASSCLTAPCAPPLRSRLQGQITCPPGVPVSAECKDIIQGVPGSARAQACALCCALQHGSRAP